MIPDKIYVTTYSVNSAHGNKWGLWTERECVGDAYIRKDALLVFLNERRKGLTSGDPFVAGERKMLKEIIEKIESL